MIRSSIEKLSEEIGFDIGMSDDVTQSNLLNGFCRALSNSMNDNQIEMQVCYIVDKLSTNSIDVIKRIYGFIEYKEKNK